MAELSPDLFFATITELNQKLVAKEFTCEELVKAFVARLETIGPRYNALAVALPQQAIRAAKQVDEEIKRNRLRGPLQGLPFAVKDLLAFKGAPTTWGAKPYAGQVFDFDATVIKNIIGVGGILTGKLSMVELAGGPSYRMASASLFGPGLNPWDRTRWSGGSSSGSATAVAAGLVPYAIGSETSGSILTPSAYCGVTGLRPTYGLVSRYGAMALSWTLDKLGPIAHTAEDCGIVLQAIAGKDGKDPGSAGKSFYYVPQYARKMKDIKLGYAPVDFETRADPAARAAFNTALDALRQTGVTLVEKKLPTFPYGAALSTILNAELASIFEELIASGKVDQLADAAQIAGMKAAGETLAKDYLKAMRLRRLMQQAFRLLFSEVDALIAPARYTPATPINQPLDAPPANPLPADTASGFSALIPAGNLVGLPALAFPCGFAGDLPVALQVVGPPFTENTLLAIGKAFQGATDWHKRRPKV